MRTAPSSILLRLAQVCEVTAAPPKLCVAPWGKHVPGIELPWLNGECLTTVETPSDINHWYSEALCNGTTDTTYSTCASWFDRTTRSGHVTWVGKEQHGSLFIPYQLRGIGSTSTGRGVEQLDLTVDSSRLTHQHALPLAQVNLLAQIILMSPMI